MNRAKKLRIALSLCLIAVLALGSTYAYLSYTSEEATENVFTFGDGMDGTIEEPHYDPGEDEETPIISGQPVPKDPFLLNTSGEDGVGAYGAVMLVFRDGTDGSVLSAPQMAALFAETLNDEDAAGTKRIALKDLTGENWSAVSEINDGTWVFYYSEVLAPGAEYDGTTADDFTTWVGANGDSVTSPLFTEVTVATFANEDLENEDGDGLKDLMPDGFTIEVYGSLVQADTFTDDVPGAQAALLELLQAAIAPPAPVDP